MSVDVVQTRTAGDRREERRAEVDLTEVDVSDLTPAGVQAFARSAVDGPVHLERRGGRAYLVVE